MLPEAPVIAITVGEPAGIGPEISLRAAWDLRTEFRSILIGDLPFLESVGHQIDSSIHLRPVNIDHWNHNDISTNPDELDVVHIPLAAPVIAGKLDLRNEQAVLACIDCAIKGAQKKQFDAIVTAPVQKSAINEAGIVFTGHTEYLAQQTGAEQVVMMLSGHINNAPSKSLSVALATTHLALKDIPQAITYQGLLRTITIIHNEFQKKFGIQKPRILLTGLNPHAGEGGYLGREEIDIIEPAIATAKQHHINVHGPYPADTIFQPHHLAHADCILAMYHDQGLPVLKYACFGHSVNITLGLPIIRTSVDHGTALDIASRGIGHADYGSMLEAIRLAAGMATRQMQ